MLKKDHEKPVDIKTFYRRDVNLKFLINTVLTILNEAKL
jgi:hypothetical protein